MSELPARRSVPWIQPALCAAIVCAALLPVVAQNDHMDSMLAGGEWHLHARVPLGTDAVLLEPLKQVVQMLATVECPQFEGWTLEERHRRPVLIDSTGHLMKKLPSSMSFRVTAGTRDKLLDTNPVALRTDSSLDDFLLGLHFEAEVFHGMEMRRFDPLNVRLIGVPSDEPSDERIYRVSFDFGQLRPDDRIVLVVTDAKGERLTKFHLEFL